MLAYVYWVGNLSGAWDISHIDEIGSSELSPEPGTPPVQIVTSHGFEGQPIRLGVTEIGWHNLEQGII